MQESFAPASPEPSLGILTSAVRRRLKQVVGARLVPFGLTPQQFWVLLVLLEQGPSSLHPLAQQVWMDDPTASRVVKAMVERGLLTTKADPRHGRRILIEVAPQALPMAQELQALALDIRQAMVEGLNERTRFVMRQGLQTMLGNLDGLLAATPAAEPPAGTAAAS